MKKLFSKFVLRWFVSSLGLWVAAALLGSSRLNLGDSWKTVIIAGFFLALVNMLVKPLLIILSFPAIILTLGLFMLVLNGALIALVSWLYNPLYVRDFWIAIVAGVIIGLVNYLVTRALKEI